MLPTTGIIGGAEEGREKNLRPDLIHLLKDLPGLLLGASGSGARGCCSSLRSLLILRHRVPLKTFHKIVTEIKHGAPYNMTLNTQSGRHLWRAKSFFTRMFTVHARAVKSTLELWPIGVRHVGWPCAAPSWKFGFRRRSFRSSLLLELEHHKNSCTLQSTRYP